MNHSPHTSTTNPSRLDPLKVFIVCDHEWYAAYSAEQALDLHRANGPEDSSLTVEHDVAEATEGDLDKPWVDREDPFGPEETARQMLAAASEPAWLTGTE